MKKRILSTILSLALIFNMAGTSAFAQDDTAVPPVPESAASEPATQALPSGDPQAPSPGAEQPPVETDTPTPPGVSDVEKPACTCPLVEGGEVVHIEGCPLYTAPVIPEAVQALIEKIDELPLAQEINSGYVPSYALLFDDVTAAYEAIVEGGMTTDELDGLLGAARMEKLTALMGVLRAVSPMAAGNRVGIELGRYSAYQVFNMEPPAGYVYVPNTTPVLDNMKAGEPFNVGTLSAPYDVRGHICWGPPTDTQYTLDQIKDNVFHMTFSEGLYGCDNWLFKDGDIGWVSAGGEVYGLSDEGFIYRGGGNNKGTIPPRWYFISNNKARRYGDNVTYTPGTGSKAVGKAELESYAANQVPLYPGEATITVGDKTTYYDTIQEAIDDASSGQTITLAQDVTLDKTLTFDLANNKNITLDMGSHTVTSTANPTFLVKSTSGTAGKLSIKGSSTTGGFVNKLNMQIDGGQVKILEALFNKGVAITGSANKELDSLLPDSTYSYYEYGAPRTFSPGTKSYDKKLSISYGGTVTLTSITVDGESGTSPSPSPTTRITLTFDNAIPTIGYGYFEDNKGSMERGGKDLTIINKDPLNPKVCYIDLFYPYVLQDEQLTIVRTESNPNGFTLAPVPKGMGTITIYGNPHPVGAYVAGTGRANWTSAPSLQNAIGMVGANKGSFPWIYLNRDNSLDQNLVVGNDVVLNLFSQKLTTDKHTIEVGAQGKPVRLTISNRPLEGLRYNNRPESKLTGPGRFDDQVTFAIADGSTVQLVDDKMDKAYPIIFEEGLAVTGGQTLGDLLPTGYGYFKPGTTQQLDIDGDTSTTEAAQIGKHTIKVSVGGTDTYFGELQKAVDSVGKDVPATITIIEDLKYTVTPEIHLKKGITLSVPFGKTLDLGSGFLYLDGGTYIPGVGQLYANVTTTMPGVNIKLKKGDTTTQTVDISKMLTGLTPFEQDNNYMIKTITNTDGILNGNPSLERDSGVLTFSIKDTAQDGQMVTIPVHAGIQAPFRGSVTINVTATVNSKEEVDITGLTAATGLTYTGKPQKGYTGDVTVEGNKPVGELVYKYIGTNEGNTYNSTTPPTNAGTYSLQVSVAGSNANYTGKHDEINFFINSTPLVVGDVAVTTREYDSTTSAAVTAVTFSGLVNGETMILGTDYTVTAAFMGKDASVNAIVNGTVQLLDNEKTKNYLLASKKFNTTATITPATLDGGVVDANPKKNYDGNNGFVNVAVTYTGGVNNETVTGRVSGTVPDANAGAAKTLTVTGQALDAAFATNYTPPANNLVTGSVWIDLIDPNITLDAPTTQIAGKDVTVTMTITNPTGATAGFPAANEVSITAGANATAKGNTTQVGTTGVYEKTFAINSNANVDDQVTFTAKVPARTTNYNPDTTGVSKTLTVSDKYGTQTTLTADKTNITYGDSVTLTATVTKAPGSDSAALVGTVQFKDGGANIGAAATIDANGKATLTVDKATLQAASGGKKYNFTAEFTSQNTNYENSVSAPIMVTVAQKALTITTQSYKSYQYKELPNLMYPLVYTGFVPGEGMDGLTNTLKAAYMADYDTGVNSNTPGDKVIKITVQGTETNTNYAITLAPGKLTVYPAGKEDHAPPALPTAPIGGTPVVVGEPTDPAKTLRVVTAVLIPEEQEQAATQLLEQGVAPADLMDAYEVELQVSTDGTTWTKATPADVKDGKVKVALPVPVGTSSATHSYRIYHFAKGANAKPDVLEPTEDTASASLTAVVTSFSPFVVVATPKNAPPSNGGGSSGNDNSEYDFWMKVKSQIDSAKSGDVVRVNAKYYDKLPASTMEALRKNSGVTLVIDWNGGKTITIPAGKAPKAEGNRVYYPLSYLAELFKNTQYVAPGQLNPETGGPGYITHADGTQTPIIGSTVVVNAPETQDSPATLPAVGDNAITAPDKGFEADAFAGTPDGAAATGNAGLWFAVIAAMLAALAGGVWFYKNKLTGQQ